MLARILRGADTLADNLPGCLLILFGLAAISVGLAGLLR